MDAPLRLAARNALADPDDDLAVLRAEQLAYLAGQHVSPEKAEVLARYRAIDRIFAWDLMGVVEALYDEFVCFPDALSRGVTVDDHIRANLGLEAFPMSVELELGEDA